MTGSRRPPGAALSTFTYTAQQIQQIGKKSPFANFILAVLYEILGHDRPQLSAAYLPARLPRPDGLETGRLMRPTGCQRVGHPGGPIRVSQTGLEFKVSRLAARGSERPACRRARAVDDVAKTFVCAMNLSGRNRCFAAMWITSRGTRSRCGLASRIHGTQDPLVQAPPEA